MCKRVQKCLKVIQKGKFGVKKGRNKNILRVLNRKNCAVRNFVNRKEKDLNTVTRTEPEVDFCFKKFASKFAESFVQ
jgi:hypothetical protein